MAGLAAYYDPGTEFEVMKFMVEDFKRVMRGHPAWAVNDAWGDYLDANPKRRPTPADIRQNIEAIVGPYHRELATRKNRERLALPQPEPEPVDPERHAAVQARARDVMEAMRRKAAAAGLKQRKGDEK